MGWHPYRDGIPFLITFDPMDASPIITLTTDWGYRDHYVAAVKGSILSSCPQARIIDITHGVEPFHIAEAAYHLKHAYPHFPKGTIHIMGVDSVASPDTPHCIVKYDDHFFIAADNGFFTLLIEENPMEAWEIDIPQTSQYFTFSTRDVFVNAACQLISSLDPGSLGPVKKELNRKYNVKPVVFNDKIQGTVIHIDAHHNAVLNITSDIFKSAAKGRRFRIEFSKDFNTDIIHTSYDDVPEGEIVALFGSHNHLEVALNRDKASTLLGLNKGDVVWVHFKSE